MNHIVKQQYWDAHGFICVFPQVQLAGLKGETVSVQSVEKKSLEPRFC